MTGKVKNSGGQVVRDLITNSSLAAYANHQHIWDGKDNSGSSVPAGNTPLS
jgi:flagellar hook assembly protein FlgD